MKQFSMILFFAGGLLAQQQQPPRPPAQFMPLSMEEQAEMELLNSKATIIRLRACMRLGITEDKCGPITPQGLQVLGVQSAQAVPANPVPAPAKPAQVPQVAAAPEKK